MKKLTKTSVLPHLDTSHQRKADGKSRYYLKVRANGIAKLYDIKPELYMDKKFWVHEVDVETKKVRKQMRIAHAKGNSDSRNLEQALAAKINEMQAIVQDIESRGSTVSHEQLALRWRTASANTLCDFVAMRIEEEKDKVTAETRGNYFTFLNGLRDYDPDVLLLEVNSEWISGFENYLRYERPNLVKGKKGLTQNTVVVYFKMLKKYLRYAALNELIPRNPMITYFGDSAIMRRFRTVLPKTEKLNAIEIDILHNAYLQKIFLEKPYGARLHETLQAILATIYTGLRLSDILQMYATNRVKIEGSHLTLVMKKVKRPISIKITNRLTEIVCLENGKPLLEGREKCQSGMNGHLRKILNLLGINKYMTWHDLRRTFATQLQANKVDIKRISELLGHTSVKMTERYIQVRSEDLDKAMDSWDEIGKGNQESEELSEVLDLVANMVKMNAGIKVPEELLGMLSGRIPESAGIWKVS